jgi:hypothetical protein
VIKKEGIYANQFRTIDFEHPDSISSEIKKEKRDQFNLISYLKMVNPSAEQSGTS